MFNYASMVWEESEFPINCACCVAYIDADDSTFDKNSMRFSPHVCEATVHRVIYLLHSFILRVDVKAPPQFGNFGISFAEVFVPHLDHWIWRGSDNQMNAGISAFRHFLAASDDDSVFGSHSPSLTYSIHLLRFYSLCRKQHGK
jgi:hypothetical protein